MAAVLRGGAASRPKPRGAAQSGSKSGKGRGSKSQGYTPAKLAAARRVGLPPQIAGMVAAAVAGVALVAALLSGHRLSHIATGFAAGLDRQAAVAGFKVKTLTVQGAT